MKISEVTKSDKQFISEITADQIAGYLKKKGAQLQGTIDATAKEEVKVIGIVNEIRNGFNASMKAAGVTPGQSTFGDLAQYLLNAGISQPNIQKAFKEVYAYSDEVNPQNADTADNMSSQTQNADIKADGGNYNKTGSIDLQRFATDKEYQDYIANTPAFLRAGQKPPVLVGRNVKNLTLNGGLKVGQTVTFTPDGKTEPVERTVVGNDAQRKDYIVLKAITGRPFSIPISRLDLKNNPAQESVIREFSETDKIPVDKIQAGIEKAVQLQYRTNGMANFKLPDSPGKPGKQAKQIFADIEREFVKAQKELDGDGDGKIDDMDGDGQPDPQTDTDGDGQPDTPTIDDEQVNTIAAQIFSLSAEQREMLTQVIRNRNLTLQAKKSTSAETDPDVKDTTAAVDKMAQDQPVASQSPASSPDEKSFARDIK